MAPVAPNITVESLERKRGALVMIEQGRFPLHTGVAVGAGSHVIGGSSKLGPVDILVALFALGGSNAKVHINKLRSKV